MSVEELGDGDVVLFERLGEDRVEELDDGDVVVAEELGHGRVQVLEHGDHDVVRPLAQVLGHGDAIFRAVEELCDGDVVILGSVQVLIHSVV